MLEYLNRYGNVSFSQAPMNDVDLAIFAELVYCPLERIARPEGLSLEELPAALEQPGEPDVTRGAFSVSDAGPAAAASGAGAGPAL